MGDGVHVAAIVLAAGRSSRMRQHKLMLPLGGRPLVTYAVDAACDSSADAVIVVVGHNASEVALALTGKHCQIVTNESFADGMATSLSSGITAVPPNVDGALILLADQPLVTSAVVNLMVAAARVDSHGIHVAAYGGRRGNPVYFPRALFGELLAVSGDEGGRSVVARYPDLIHLVPMPFEEAALDVDTPGEFERLIADWECYSAMVTG